MMTQLRKLGGVCGVVLVLLLAGSEVRAAGGTAYVVRWTQPNQCELVDHWVMMLDGVDSASLDAACDGTMAVQAMIAGAGPYSVTLKAVTANGFESAPSNAIGITVPLAAPTLSAIEPL